MNSARASPRIAALETKKATMRYSQSPVGGQRATVKNGISRACRVRSPRKGLMRCAARSCRA
eukprot:3563606-Alexandrium_andersonii.AAC.1